LIYRYINLIRRKSIPYYLARDLAAKLNLNLAKWKRWSREFLPSDPLGGLQSGFARQYSLKDAFVVSLGGFLVGELKFAVPEARAILKDLKPWLKKAGYLRLRANGGSTGKDSVANSHDIIFVRPSPKTGGSFLYWMEILGSTEEGGGWGPGETFSKSDFFSYPGVRVVNLGGFARRFYESLK
jgi:hypothetical protein